MKTTKSEAKVNTSTEKAIKFDTKATLKAKLKKLLPVIVKRDDALAHTVDYALGRAKTTRDELVDLFKQVDALISTPVAENQVKPKKPTAPKNKKVKEEEEPENPEVIADADEDEEEQPKKKTLKSKSKKSEKIEVSEPKIHVNGYLPSAKVFPEILEHEDLGTLKIAKFRNYDEVVEALDSGVEIFIANYWTKKHIKQYGYSSMTNTPSKPKEFKHDLDICMAIVHTESFKRLWAMSQYTEGMFFYEEEDFEYVKDTDAKTDEDFEVRVSNGMEFEIYVHADAEI